MNSVTFTRKPFHAAGIPLEGSPKNDVFIAFRSKKPFLTASLPGARKKIAISAPKNTIVLAVEIRNPRLPRSLVPPRWVASGGPPPSGSTRRSPRGPVTTAPPS